jgi:hypothetical protein
MGWLVRVDRREEHPDLLAERPEQDHNNGSDGQTVRSPLANRGWPFSPNLVRMLPEPFAIRRRIDSAGLASSVDIGRWLAEVDMEIVVADMEVPVLFTFEHLLDSSLLGPPC